jgi:hypothetical protein
VATAPGAGSAPAGSMCATGIEFRKPHLPEFRRRLGRNTPLHWLPIENGPRSGDVGRGLYCTCTRVVRVPIAQWEGTDARITTRNATD